LKEKLFFLTPLTPISSSLPSLLLFFAGDTVLSFFSAFFKKFWHKEKAVNHRFQGER